MTLSRIASVALALGVAPALATAQAARDSARADSAARQLKAVTVTETRSAGTVGGASAVVVRTEELRSAPAPLLEQALRESPFVHVRQNSRGEMELSVRGSDSRQAAVLLDGVPLTLGWDHRTDPSLVPVTGAQSLVIVRGLGTLLNGPNTLGGTIEVSHDDAFGRTGTGGVWSSVGVDENAAFVASVGGGRTLEKRFGGSLSVRGGVAHRQRDGFSLPGRAFDTTSTKGLRTNSDLRHSDAFGLLRWDNGRGRALGLTVAGFNAERGVPPEEHIASPRLWRYPYSTRAIVSVSGRSGTFATPLGFGSLDVGGGYNSGREKIESFSDRTYRSVTAQELGDERTLTGRALFTHSLPGSATLKAAFTMANVDYTESLPPIADADYRQIVLSGGAEVEAPVGLKTTLAGGLVYDRSSTPESGGRARAAPFDNIGWRAGIVHEVSAEWRVHASASQRSRFPALRELYSGALNRFTPNPDLEPETLVGLEAGVTVDRALGPIPDATLQVNAFHHNLDDAIVRITLQNPTRFFRLNRDRIESMGAEMLAGFVFGDDRSRSVSLTGDAIVQRIRIHDITASDAERRPENNPEVRGMLELGVPIPGAMRGFANVRYTGRQYCVHPDTQSQMELEGQAEADLALERQLVASRRGFFRSLRAVISLDNVTDATVYDQCGLPQPGRTLRMMVTLR